MPLVGSQIKVISYDGQKAEATVRTKAFLRIREEYHKTEANGQWLTYPPITSRKPRTTRPAESKLVCRGHEQKVYRRKSLEPPSRDA